MAFLPGDDEQQQKTPGDETPIIPGSGAGAGAAGKPGSGPVALEQPTQNTASTPEVVDTASYLAANRPQAESLGGLLSGRLASEQSELQGDIGTQFGDYGSQVEAGRTQFDEDVIQRAALDPTGFTANPDDLEKFTKQRTAEYKGPGEVGTQDFYSKLQHRVEGVGRRPGQVESEQGRESLLFEMSGANPTQGQVTLDQLLLSQNPNVREELKSSVAGAPGVASEFASQAEGVKEQRVGAIGEAARAQEAVNEAFYGEGGTATQFNEELGGRLEETRGSQQEQSDAAIADLLDGGALDPVNAQYLGITSPAAHQEFLKNIGALQADYGSPLKIDQYLQQFNAEGKIPSLESISTLEDVAKQQALQQLLGQDYMAPLQADQVQAGMRPDFGLANFNEAEANRQSEMALRENDENLLGNGVAAVWAIPAYENPPEFGDNTRGRLQYEDVPETHQLYNAIMRHPEMRGVGDPSTGYRAPDGSVASNAVSAFGRFADTYEGQFGVPDQPGVVDTTQPTDNSPWQTGQERLRVIDGQGMSWWDGGQWAEAPPEYTYQDAGGNQVGPGERVKTLQFDYNTGQYNLIEELQQPGTGGGGLPPGVYGTNPVI